MVSVRESHFDVLEGPYNFMDPTILTTMYHEHVIHKNLFRNLPSLVEGTWDEVQAAVDDGFGMSTTKWTDVPNYDTLMHIIARVSNRMMVGLPLCRDETYLANNSAFAQDVINVMTGLSFVPKVLHPVLGRLASIPNHIHFNRVKKLNLPMIRERLAQLTADPSRKDVPNDYITWHIRTAQAEKNTEELDPTMISRRLMPLNFAAIHTTTFTIVNTLFDLLGSDPKHQYIELLREEAERVFASCNGDWSKTALGQMVRTDSAIRESMRISNFGAAPLTRKVVAKDGLTNEEEGWTAPHGSFVSVNAHSVHHDPDIYPEPMTYDAFRFSRPREEFEARQKQEQQTATSNTDTSKDMAETLKMRSAGLITTSDTFLPFGHGRHACPGRFFVNHELKMLLAYVFMNYDLQYLEKRPENQWFASSILPPMKDVIKVKRREGSVRK